MSDNDRFRITYIGGGSRFVVTLLHGLAAKAEALGRIGRPIELVLVDVDTSRATEMARYAEIVATRTQLPIKTLVTEDTPGALEGAGWVIFSAGLWEPIQAARKKYAEDLGLPPHGESAPSLVAECAGVWGFLASAWRCRDLWGSCPTTFVYRKRVSSWSTSALITAGG